MGDGSYSIPQFQSETFYFDLNLKKIKYQSVFPVDQLVSETDFEISNLVYESIDVSELGDLNVNAISNRLDFKVNSTMARE